MNYCQGVKDFMTIMEPINGHIEALDNFLLSQMEYFEPELVELAHYALNHKGKRIRPMLVFFSGWREDGVINQELVKVAGIVELVHLATLVHDDILDNAAMRHNTPSVYTKYGSKAAVLLGDALFAHALTLAAEFKTNTVCYEVAKSTRRVCAGEIKQNFHSSKASYKVEDYYRIIDLKTAELFSVACYLGSHLGEYPDGYTKAVAAFGRHLGIAYQIYDDLIDILGIEGDSGKTLGTDLMNGKQTLPLLLLLQELDIEEREYFLKQVQNGGIDGKEFKRKIIELGIVEEVVQAFYEEIRLSNEAIKGYHEFQSFSYLFDFREVVVYQVEYRIKTLLI